jgi:hypothetical protein
MKTIIFSHGFAVRKDNRGMFTDIASALPDYNPVMFDYDKVESKDGKTFLTPEAIENNVKKLENEVKSARENNPTGEISVVAQSRGCIIALLANLSQFNVKNLVLIAFPPETGDVSEKAKNYWRRREGSYIREDGVTYMPRKDGSVTLITPEYWASYAKFQDTDFIDLANEKAVKMNVFIIKANQDEILGDVDYPNLSAKVDLIPLDGGHNFDAPYRQPLLNEVKAIFEA